ncbi:hypothetical protein SAMN05445850_2546 [Paraburkholderia tuberum]|uniref:Uncharacterized protein n=1 Tax=Paraburkholderia tuberum TaxID=157910 RepID=A0A1H1FSF4_9BURK|nr:hypothetical protein SAMN05445850_2546 [Paraburkholderia tuberum]
MGSHRSAEELSRSGRRLFDGETPEGAATARVIVGVMLYLYTVVWRTMCRWPAVIMTRKGCPHITEEACL